MQKSWLVNFKVLGVYEIKVRTLKRNEREQTFFSVIGLNNLFIIRKSLTRWSAWFVFSSLTGMFEFAFELDVRFCHCLQLVRRRQLIWWILFFYSAKLDYKINCAIHLIFSSFFRWVAVLSGISIDFGLDISAFFACLSCPGTSCTHPVSDRSSSWPEIWSSWLTNKQDYVKIH